MYKYDDPKDIQYEVRNVTSVVNLLPLFFRKINKQTDRQTKIYVELLSNRS